MNLDYYISIVYGICVGNSLVVQDKIVYAIWHLDDFCKRGWWRLNRVKSVGFAIVWALMDGKMV